VHSIEYQNTQKYIDRLLVQQEATAKQLQELLVTVAAIQAKNSDNNDRVTRLYPMVRQAIKDTARNTAMLWALTNVHDLCHSPAQGD
jgi:hypothetical protein